MRQVTITLNERDALMVVTALGVLKDRIGQKGRWLERKRKPLLRHRLADCITIGDETEQAGVRKALKKTQDEINRRIQAGEDIAKLMRDVYHGDRPPDTYVTHGTLYKRINNGAVVLMWAVLSLGFCHQPLFY